MHLTGAPALVFAMVVVYWFFFLANLMACVFIGVAASEGFCSSWVVQLASAPGKDCGGTLALPDELSTYVTALYFSTMTLTTVGYGDVVAKTALEKSVVVLFMLISAFFMATVREQRRSSDE